MSVLFAERYGHIPRKPLQVDDLDQATRNLIFNLFYEPFFDEHFGYNSDRSMVFLRVFFKDFFKKIQKRFYGFGEEKEEITSLIQKFITEEAFYKVFDFLEFFGTMLFEKNFDIKKVVKGCSTRINSYCYYISELNQVFENERVGYRMVNNGQIVPIINHAEIDSLNEGIQADDIAAQHLSEAIRIFSNRETHDYPNTIKESIAALEAKLKEIIGESDSDLTFGPALKKFEQTQPIHPALKKALDGLHGYACNAGARHADKPSNPNITFDEAKLVLVTCSALVNYLAALQTQQSAQPVKSA